MSCVDILNVKIDTHSAVIHEVVSVGLSQSCGQGEGKSAVAGEALWHWQKWKAIKDTETHDQRERMVFPIYSGKRKEPSYKRYGLWWTIVNLSKHSLAGRNWENKISTSLIPSSELLPVTN